MPQKQLEKNIYLRGPYQYQVRLMVSGRRISETFSDLPSARAYRDKIKSDSAIDPEKRRVIVERIRKRDAANETLGRLLDRYYKEVSVTKKSADTDRLRIGKIKRHWIADVSVYALSRSDLSKLFDWLQAGETLDGKHYPGASGSSVRRYASLLSHALKTAKKRWGMPVSNPVPDVELPANGKLRNRRLEDSEEKALLTELGKLRNPFILPAWKFAIESTCRRSELLALEWSDVDLKERIALFRDTKNGTDRLAPLTSNAVKVLKQLEKTRNPKERRVLTAIYRGIQAL